MKTLPNGLVVFNATPHPITFGCGDNHDDIVVVESDTAISASITETPAGYIPMPCRNCRELNGEHSNECFDPHGETATVDLVSTKFVGTDTGRTIIEGAFAAKANVIIGSIIAAQAYPGQVLAMTPCPGFERRPPAEKRMRCDKFTIYR